MASTLPYSVTLRVIGQSLEGRPLEQFDLERVDGGFVIRGIERPQAPRGLFRRRLRLMPQNTVPLSLEFRYSEDDLLALERAGQTRRKDPNRTPDFYGLSQMLRTVGAYIDRRALQFVKLSRDGPKLTLEFEERNGGQRIEDHSIPSFYNSFVHMYLRRRPRTDMSF